MFHFTKDKFLKLSLQTQHKKLALILREVYEQSIRELKPPSRTLLSTYHKMLSWIDFPPLTPSCENLKKIADRFHMHLKHTTQKLCEQNFLPHIEKQDKTHANPSWPIAIYLDHLRSAHNVGSILRTTEAMSLGSVYFSESTPFIDHKQVQKTSMGASEWVSCFQGIALSHLPKPIIVLETATQACSVHDFVFPENFTLVVGNEEYGCSDESLQQADYLLHIPLSGRKNSLNVSNAFAITAAAIQRQYLFQQTCR